MKVINITLTPMDTYFFGMENRNTDNTQSYYLKSLMIPKQSTVIGIVRYLLLMQAGNEIFKENKIQDKNEAKNLIGERSYEVSLSDFELGKIQSISPIYILHNKKFYFLSPSINQKAEIKNVGKIAVIDHNHDFKNMQSALISNEGDTQQLDNVFINHFQSNNNKNDTNETRSDAFFKTCYYKLKDGIGFGITIEVDDDVMINTTDSFYAKIGGENKLFKIECIQGENNYEAQAHEALKCWKQKDLPTSVALGDIYFNDASILHKCLFYAAHKSSTRYLKSSVDHTDAFNKVSKQDRTANINHSSNLERSGILDILNAGSIFYFENNEQQNMFHEALNSNQQKAGFNKIIKL